MKICPQCKTEVPDNEQYCPKDGISLEKVPSMPNFGSMMPLIHTNQMYANDGNSRIMGVPITPRSIMPSMSAGEKILHLFAQINLMSGVKTVIIPCPCCGEPDDFRIEPLIKGVKRYHCRNNPNHQYEIRVSWYNDYDVYPI